MTENSVFPKSTLEIPMPAVKPPKRPLDEVDNGPMTAMLTERGILWPLRGYAPGLYAQTCNRCGKRHTADKRAMRCLPCALVAAVETSREMVTDRERAVAEGRRLAVEDVKRALGIVEAPVAALGLVRERIEGALNAPAYATETLELAVKEIDGWIGART